MKKLIFIASIIALSISSCDQGLNKSGSNMVEEAVYINDATERPIPEAPTDKADLGPERKLIKTGNLRFKTDNIKDITEMIRLATQKYHGYIALNKSHEYMHSDTHELQIKVPSKDFDNLITDITKHVEKFDDKSINTIDVSKEYIDVQARLKTRKALAKRYIELLKKTSKISEILAIENELTIQQTKIESAEGQLKYLKSQTSFATLNLRGLLIISSNQDFHKIL